VIFCQPGVNQGEPAIGRISKVSLTLKTSAFSICHRRWFTHLYKLQVNNTVGLRLLISNSAISNSPLFRSQNHFPWICFEPSVVFSAISNCFPFPPRVRNSEFQLYYVGTSSRRYGSTRLSVLTVKSGFFIPKHFSMYGLILSVSNPCASSEETKMGSTSIFSLFY